MNKDQLFKFCLIAKEEDLINYLTFSCTIARIIKASKISFYEEKVQELIKQYKL